MVSAPDPAQIEAIHTKSFGYGIARLARLFSDRLAEALAGTGLQMSHVLVLATLRAQHELDANCALTQTRLGRLTGIEKSSLGFFLDALEKDGWVQRAPHLKDRRAHIVTLTEGGAHRFEAIGQRLHEREMANLEPLSPAERLTFMSMISRLLPHLQSD